MSKLLLCSVLGIFYTLSAWSQTPPPGRESVPIYSVTVVERTVKAVNYQYRGGPTPIDFRGTVLLPKAKGDAIVESKAGRIEVDARFQHLEAPTRYGAEYLTYVLWAITPEGHARNLGEVLPGSSDHAHLHVTTDMQAFGMIVTAEPYSAVRLPSDVVVLENEVRPDTIGRIEPVQARYELLPRGHYVYNVPSGLGPAPAQGEMLSMDRYESLLEVYQAQNAIQIARAAGADRYAPDVFGKAENLLHTAQDYQSHRADRSTVVTVARQAAQTAEDARAITLRHKQDEELQQARDQTAREQERRAKAEADLQAAQRQASAERMQLEQERQSRDQAFEPAAAPSAAISPAASAAAMTAPPPPPPAQAAPIEAPMTMPAQMPANGSSRQTELRVRLLQECGAALNTRDTPRGLVVTLPDSDFRGSALNSAVYSAVARVAASIASHGGLYVQVEGNTSSSGGSREEDFSYERAAAVREALVRGGVPQNAISARGLGASRPLVSNASAAGREQNRRVEITISGDPIGSVPYWDRTYSLVPRR